ncbi:SEC-C motif-containing protein [Arthrobacter stackebrandtii]|uniref:UPF0225 protein JOF48_003116 n=1 Tax=Arthrobacter stackebrandtii TaxID=272161 RepID=A0ABS4YZU7_9MICC|nr:YchJ family metal-binding protein [Arthrobacter stackebrandtii]MBP2414317.1 SEC-C motif-containing protein [Arthrobacter stackebrandtii]PYH01470.1 hypothetical protein CVV67_02980 [Arthrobacter stackebrandtii]
MIGPESRCPCSSGEQFGNCCARYLSTEAPAPTAEALMRSRFSAFATANADYLLRTWHPETRPAILELDPDQQWYLLEILAVHDGGAFATAGTVTFRAHYRSATDRRQRDSFTETSSFVREAGRWFYVDALELS